MQNSSPPTPDPVGTSELIADPYTVYARLRQAGPVHRITGPDGLPAWLVTRYDDVRHAFTDPRLSLDKAHATPGNYRGFSLPPALDANLLNMDPPDHTRVRRLVSAAFTPGRVHALRGPVRRTADDLLDALAGRDGADLIESYAGPLPIAVICELLGVPAADRPDFRAWTDLLVTPDPGRPHLTAQAVRDLVAFLAGLIAAKRERPGDDLISAMTAARDDGDRLSEDELTSLAFLILFAGYENTVHLVANAVLALLDHPDQMARLRAEPSLIAGAVEEFARFDGPVAFAIRRFPVEDIEIGGTAVPAGDTVMLAVASANRDPGHFPDPDRLTVDRPAAGHMSLGHGIHYCLGAPLARMETEIALSALLERFPSLSLGVPREELAWRPSIRARGLIALPVTWS